jgi:MarR family transcriptional regulator, lower aerobic nicotinate degradation pathway regulator
VTLPAVVDRLPTWLLTQAALHAHRLVSERLGEVGGHRFDYRVLAVTAEEGPMSQAALGRRTGIHTSDLVSHLNGMADRGLVARVPDPSDRRRNLITVTPVGRTQLRRLARQVARIQDEMLAPLDPAERDVLVDLLARVLEHHARRARPG